MLREILLILLALVVIYVIYLVFFKKTDKASLVSSHNAKESAIISANKLPNSNSNNFTYSCWVYIDDWNYRFGEKKVIFGRLDQNQDPCPSVVLGSNQNNLDITVSVYPDTGTSQTQDIVVAPRVHTCEVQNIPIQKWVCIIVTVNNRAMDIYLDGKLVRTCMLPGVPRVAPSSDVYLTPNGGFDGYVKDFEYHSYAVNPSQAYNIYKDGLGGGIFSGLSDFANKYRLKVAFVEDQKEVNSFEI